MAALIPQVLAAVLVALLAGFGSVVLCRRIQRLRSDRVTESLRDVGDRWRRVVEISPDAVFVHVDGRIVFANPAMVALMDARGADQLVGMDALEILHPEQRQFIRERRSNMSGNGEAMQFQTMRYQSLEGRDIWAEAGAAILSWDGRDGFAVVAHDITARRMAENALRESEARYRAVVEDQEEFIGRALPDGTLTFVNDAFCRYFDRDREQLVGNRFFPMIPDSDQAGVQEILATLSPDNPRVTLEHRVIRPDGEIRWHRWVDRLICDAQGIPLELQAVGRDITPQKRAEQALRDSEARYRGIVEDQTELIARYVPDGALTFVNDAYCRFFGLTRDAVLGRPFVTRIPSGEHPEIELMIRRLQSGGSLETRERRVVRPDGEVLWIQWTNRAIRDADGKLVEIQAVGRDITEQRNAADAVQASEARLREIIDLAPGQIFVRDMEGRFLLVNRAVADLYGTTAEALSGKLQRDFHPDPDEMERFLESDRRLLNGGEREFIPLQTFHDGHGRVRYVETTKIPFTWAENGVRAVIGVSQDVTEQREAAEQLHQAQKMEAVGQLTGGIAHDFNNLLAVILGNLQLLERDIAGDIEQSGLAGAAVDAARRGASLTRQLLAFSRQQPLEPVVLNLNELIGGATDLLTRSLGESYTVSRNLADDLWNSQADRSQVENAILNLVINAGQAMPAGGRIDIQTRNAVLSERDVAGLAEVAAGEYVAVSVEDNGCGMAPEVAERAFEPFFTTKSVGGGSGLGLSMVYGFIRQSQGHARIDSVVGEGTSVTLYLPRTTAGISEIAETPAFQIDAVAADVVVMVVEDDPDVRDVAVKLLAQMGYRVRAAESGPDALRQIDLDPNVDILFTDMVLPEGMSGGELAVEVRRWRGDLPILFTSGNTEIDPARDSRLSGGFSFLRKPYLADELASKLRELSLGD